MIVETITKEEKDAFNELATHPLQSFDWGEFRKKSSVIVIRKGFYEKGKLVEGFQLTIHKIPKTPWTIGYLPKGILPTKEIINELKKIGEEYNCIFIQLEPNVEQNEEFTIQSLELGLLPSAHPLFTKYTFTLDISKSEEELLKSFHSKTRYNIRVAEKYGVKVEVKHDDTSFQKYIALVHETTSRQKFYAHTDRYHQLMWKTLRRFPPQGKHAKDELKAHFLLATYQDTPLVAWILFSFHDTLYYPYGASSNAHREVMASNFMMWEAIRFGKKLGLNYFDLWGALGENPNKNDPWYGFHRFKEGYAPRHVTFIGSFDLVINPFLYQGYKFADTLRWFYLKLKK